MDDKLTDDISQSRSNDLSVSDAQKPGGWLWNLIDLFTLVAVAGSVAESLLIDSRSRPVCRWNYRRNYSQRLIY